MKSDVLRDEIKVSTRTITVLILFISLIFVWNKVAIGTSPMIEQGKLDLSDWDMQEDGMLTLNGDWAFYWNQFVEDIDTSMSDGYVHVPNVWNHYTIREDNLPGFGYATYALRITGVEGELALKIPPCSTAYELYVDDNLVAQNGVVSRSASGAVPNFEPKSVVFNAARSGFTIKMFVSNFTYARGGIWYSLSLGTKDQIEVLDRSITYKQSFIVGGIATIMMFCVCAYCLGIRRLSLIYFVLLSLFSVIRIMAYGDYLIMQIVRSFRLAVILEYSTLTLFPMIIALFLQSLMKSKRNYMTATTIIPSSIAFLLTILTPVYFFTKLVWIFEAWGLIITVSSLFFLTREKQKNNNLLAAGALAIIICGLIDILYQNCVITAMGELSPFGYYLMLVFWGIALVKYYTDMVAQSRLSLHKANQAELAFLQAQIKPHFLYNALDAIANVCEKDGKKGSDLIVDLAIYLRNKLQFSSLEKMVSLEQELDFVSKYFTIEQARFGTKIRMEMDVRVSRDIRLPALILQPLVENAVRHGISKNACGGTVWVSIYYLNQDVLVEVKDNGEGIEPDRLALLLSEARADSGVGIINIHERLVHMYGKGLDITSAPRHGTCVKFMIPEGGKHD